ncbi:MAG: Trk system potassium transporter TrkA [Bacillota bacterium]
MKAIVIGAGKVGFHIAERLSEENHDVVLIDAREEALVPAQENLDVMTVAGNGASPKTLEQAGVATADMVIAVTTHDESNIIACLTAKYYGVPTTVARVRNPDYTLPTKALVQGMLGIDHIIHPERLAAAEIVKLLKTPSAGEVGFYADGKVQLLGIRCDTPGAECLHKPLHQLGLRHSLVVAVERDGDLLIPDGNTKLELGDYFYVIGRSGNFERSTFLAGRIPSEIRSVTIVGGGETGLRICEILSGYQHEGLSVKLIEQDPERARWLAEQLSSVLIIEGDGTDVGLLESEQLGECDALVAATGQEETNLLIAMVAKKLGVKEIIVELGREEYGTLADTIGVHATIIPRLLTASTILRLLQKDRLVDLAFLKQGMAEVMEVMVADDAPVIGRPLRNAGLPAKSLIGTIIRGHEIIIPHGNSEIRPRDRVIAFCHVDSSSALKKALGL